MRSFYLAFPIRDTLRHELSWSHYRLLCRIDSESKRQYYLNESIACNWNVHIDLPTTPDTNPIDGQKLFVYLKSLSYRTGKIIAIISVILENIVYMRKYSTMTENIAKASKYNFWGSETPDLGYERVEYLEKIKLFTGNKLVKVMVGQRRAGKSYLLWQIYSGFGYGMGYLMENPVYLHLSQSGNEVYVGVLRECGSRFCCT